ncbi:MAG: PDZ domain-containing protein [Firmicutes bacterium]|nr:PDZ domain-containing protein [Bacillota bacterium]
MSFRALTVWALVAATALSWAVPACAPRAAKAAAPPASPPQAAAPAPPQKPGPLPGEQLLQPQQMLADLRHISATIQEVHPALADRAARAGFAARAQALEAQLQRPQPAWRFFALANGLVNSLEDAHTHLWVPDAGGMLPIRLTWAEDGAVVTGVLDPTLPVRAGDQLVSLGGRSPEQLLAALDGWIPHGNPYWVKALAGQYLTNTLVLQGLGLVSAPDPLQPETVQPETVQIVVRRRPPAAEAGAAAALITAEVPVWSGLTVVQTLPITDLAGRSVSPAAEAGLRPGDHILKMGGEPVASLADFSRLLQQYGREDRPIPLEILRHGRRMTVNLRPAATRAPGTPPESQPVYKAGVAFGSNPAPERPWFGWTVNREAGYGLFWLDQCNDTREYRRAVDQFFAAVRKEGIPRIAIDLRRNGGGNSMVVRAFLKYLPYKSLRAGSGWTRPSAQLTQQRSFWLRALAFLSQTFFNGRWFPYPIQPRAPADQLFRGQVVVLTSWKTFSAAVDFAAMLSDNHLATLAGAPTGGTPSEYGDILNFTTPNTGWSFSVSTTRFVRPDPARDPADALYPDVPIATTVRDLQEGRDAVVEWLRQNAE